MRLAEDLTSPRGDPVYDGIGMVPTRPSINYHWFLHSLNVKSLVKNARSPIARDVGRKAGRGRHSELSDRLASK